MQTDPKHKHTTTEKDEKHEHHHRRHSHPKHQAAEEMEDSQWKKHPGGG